MALRLSEGLGLALSLKLTDPREFEETLALLPGIVAVLSNESDRGCVLVAAALVEAELENHIVRRLLPKAAKYDELVSEDSRAPISTFSQKINLAYRVGLIPLSERTIYHQLRELRNGCAHDITAQTFTQDHFRGRTSNIVRESSELWEALRASVSRKMEPDTCPTTVKDFVEQLSWRYAFEFFFALVVAHKRIQLPRVPPIETAYAA